MGEVTMAHAEDGAFLVRRRGWRSGRGEFWLPWSSKILC